MLQGWVVVAVAAIYIGLLFAVASYGDRRTRSLRERLGRPNIYALSLAAYCTSWTFLGSVGLAASEGLDFLAIYIGPIIVFGLAHPLIRRIVRLAKAEKITSIADFLGARYGKSQPVAAVATLIAVLGTLPYIALQLRAVSFSVLTLVEHLGFDEGLPVFADIALLVAIALALFAILFGTRHIDATEHQDGLMLAIAAESVVKLAAFLIVGVFVTYVMFDGVGDLMARAAAVPEADILSRNLPGGTWITMTLLSTCAILLLPRQFHVTVVESHSADDVRRAAWLFPLYLVLINLFVVPIAIAGLLTFGSAADADSFVLRLPMSVGAGLVTLFAFIGGLSAATAMVIVAAVALAIMVSNEIVMPLLLRRRPEESGPADMGRFLLNVRRIVIVAILLLSFCYHRVAADSAGLAQIGLLSFAAIAQFAPAFFGGLVWRRGTARGAIAGMTAGFLVWAYTLLLPSFAGSDLLPPDILTAGPFGISFLRPQALFSFDFDPLSHGVFWSLLINSAAYVLVSLSRALLPIERLQASIFVPSELAPVPALRLWRTSATVEDLRSTVARYLGAERTERSFASFERAYNLALEPNRPADIHLLRFSEQLLASAIGAASARLVLSLLLKRREASSKVAIRLLDDASAAIQYNRDLLQTALDQVRQGIAVFDRALRLTCWNRQFRELLGLPAEFGQVGTPLNVIVAFNATRGEFGDGPVEEIVAERVRRIAGEMVTHTERLAKRGTILEVRANPMPDGGIVTTWTDITERERAAEALARANETLEGRVRERTEELTRLNRELERARAAAEEANIGKTRFIAAAGHDILQPLNAARLYVTSLVERARDGEERRLVQNVDAALEAVEEILGAVLDISRLDTGALKPEITAFRLDDVFAQLAVEFAPMAHDKGLRLTIVPCSLSVRSDRRLLRRLLNNLVSNAIKYTPKGRILVGCRRRRGRVRIFVIDTGIGIPASKKGAIFKEFQRLDAGAREARGLGLGLSIVERIARVLDHTIDLDSEPGKGSRFSVELPLAAAVPVAPARGPAVPAPPVPLAETLVLCIDNEPKILDGMEALLSGWGCTVAKAANEKEALARIGARGRVPDVALVDYHLDETNGIDVILALRWKLSADLPAVLITADRAPAIREAAQARDIAVLYKPVKPAALRAVIAQWRAQRPAAE